MAGGGDEGSHDGDRVEEMVTGKELDGAMRLGSDNDGEDGRCKDGYGAQIYEVQGFQCFCS